MVSDKFAFPGAVQWKGVSDLVTTIFGGGSGQVLLTTSIIWSIAIAATAALVMEIVRLSTRNRFPFSRSPSASASWCRRTPRSRCLRVRSSSGSCTGSMQRERIARGHKLWVDTQEPICAGIIAGAALIGIGDVLVKVFLLDA